jgi:hypothetical protein
MALRYSTLTLTHVYVSSQVFQARRILFDANLPAYLQPWLLCVKAQKTKLHSIAISYRARD